MRSLYIHTQREREREREGAYNNALFRRRRKSIRRHFHPQISAMIHTHNRCVYVTYIERKKNEKYRDNSFNGH